MTAPVAVLGARGFVGSAVVAALHTRGVPTQAVRAPRELQPPYDAEVHRLAGEITGCLALINAAGISDASSVGTAAMTSANERLPYVGALAARQVGIRYVHVSSAAVQGNRENLDSSVQTQTFSAYSESKAGGEAAVAAAGGDYCIYRPPGVHHESRHVTQRLAALARSRLSTVAGQGDAPSAQALLENVADAIAYLALCRQPPPIVHHGSEGLTTASVLEALGGRPPRRLPDALTRPMLSLTSRAGAAIPSLAGQARRLEVLWLGQQQAASWLEEAGWRPVVGLERWADIGANLRAAKRPTEETQA